MFTDEQIKQLEALLAPIETRLSHLEHGQQAQGQRLAAMHDDLASLKKGQTSLEHGQARLEQRHEALERRQETLELKVEVVNQRVISAEQTIKDAIQESQQDIINVLSEMIQEAYSLHEPRIQRLEDALHLPPLPPAAHEA